MGDRAHILLSYHEVGIAESGTTSDAIDTSEETVVGLEVPASLDSTSISFTCCESSDGTFVPLRDTTNTPLSITCDNTAGQFFFDPSNFAGVRFLKVVMGTTETSARTLKLITRKLA